MLVLPSLELIRFIKHTGAHRAKDGTIQCSDGASSVTGYFFVVFGLRTVKMLCLSSPSWWRSQKSHTCYDTVVDFLPVIDSEGNVACFTCKLFFHSSQRSMPPDRLCSFPSSSVSWGFASVLVTDAAKDTTFQSVLLQMWENSLIGSSTTRSGFWD